jgi:hypothetical protein
MPRVLQDDEVPGSGAIEDGGHLLSHAPSRSGAIQERSGLEAAGSERGRPIVRVVDAPGEVVPAPGVVIDTDAQRVSSHAGEATRGMSGMPGRVSRARGPGVAPGGAPAPRPR